MGQWRVCQRLRNSLKRTICRVLTIEDIVRLLPHDPRIIGYSYDIRGSENHRVFCGASYVYRLDFLLKDDLSTTDDPRLLHLGHYTGVMNWLGPLPRGGFGSSVYRHVGSITTLGIS